jgi:hypothetical protein
MRSGWMRGAGFSTLGETAGAGGAGAGTLASAAARRLALAARVAARADGDFLPCAAGGGVRFAGAAARFADGIDRAPRALPLATALTGERFANGRFAPRFAGALGLRAPALARAVGFLATGFFAFFTGLRAGRPLFALVFATLSPPESSGRRDVAPPAARDGRP